MSCSGLIALAWVSAVLGLILGLSRVGYVTGRGVGPKATSKLDDNVLQKPNGRLGTSKAHWGEVPDYLQKLYKVFESIPAGSKIQDLTVHALKPTKETMISGNRIRSEFKCHHDLLNKHLNQVEVVLSKKGTEKIFDQAPPLVVTVCWSRIFCLHHLSLLPNDEFLIGDVTASTKRFFSQTSLTGQPEITTLAITIAYGAHQHHFESYQPIVVFHSVPKDNYTPPVRPHGEGSWKEGRRHNHAPKHERRSKRTAEEGLEYRGPCKLQDWTIYFADIGWSSRIIMPEQYTANLCVGQCNSPAVINHVNLSSHAYLRHIFYEANHGLPPVLRDHNNNTIKVPQACCVPVMFDPVSTLFKNKDATLTLKRIDEAIATRCGCV